MTANDGSFATTWDVSRFDCGKYLIQLWKKASDLCET